jgi:hypothetical protein
MAACQLRRTAIASFATCISVPLSACLPRRTRCSARRPRAARVEYRIGRIVYPPSGFGTVWRSGSPGRGTIGGPLVDRRSSSPDQLAATTDPPNPSGHCTGDFADACDDSSLGD